MSKNTLTTNLNILSKLRREKEISIKDKKEAMLLYGISESQLSRYLNNKGTSPDTAYDLAHFFSKRRDARLNGTKFCHCR